MILIKRYIIQLKYYFDLSYKTQNEVVAVKVFLSNLENKIDTFSFDEMIGHAKERNQVYHAYKEIRQEV